MMPRVLRHNRGEPREERMTAPGEIEDVTALRGTIVTCRDDPFLTDPGQGVRDRDRRHRDLPQRR